MEKTERKLTFKRMDEHFQRAPLVDFNPDNSRVIVFCDSHKWDRGETDFFKSNEPVYCGALNYYAMRRYRLILAGDIEEGAGQPLKDAVRHYPHTFDCEKQFVPREYLRLYGDHDHAWKEDAIRRQYLEKALEHPLAVYPAVRLGEKILIVHGHEGDLMSDELRGFSNAVLRIFKRFVEAITFKSQRAAENYKLRRGQAKRLFEWGKARRQIVIAGHTHLAYFESISVTCLLEKRIKKLEELINADSVARENSGFLADLSRFKKAREELDRFADRGETISASALPYYFNAGCCIYRNGITGIEIEEGVISLVKWASRNGDLIRTPLASKKLSDLISAL